jgi:hypothetical protein
MKGDLHVGMRKMKRKTKTILVAIAVTTAIAVVVVSARTIVRERERSHFSGCNALHCNLAALDHGIAKFDLAAAEADTNTPPDKLDILKQRFMNADAKLRKWEAHGKKYGHLHGNAESSKN